MQGRETMLRTEETAMKLYNLEQLEVIRDAVTSTKCLLAWGQDTIVVAFRGTANRQNAAHDIKVTCTSHFSQLKPGVGRVKCTTALATSACCTECEHKQGFALDSSTESTLLCESAKSQSLQQSQARSVLQGASLRREITPTT